MHFNLKLVTMDIYNNVLMYTELNLMIIIQSIYGKWACNYTKFALEGPIK